MAIAFAVTLTENDWDGNLSAWRCFALRIPGAVVDALFVGGARVDPSWYEQLPDHGMVRWVRSDEVPAAATCFIKLTQELSTQELTAKWKKLAIVLPFAASLLVALLSGSVTYLTKKGGLKSAATPVQEESAKLAEARKEAIVVGPAPKGIIAASPISDFSIMMPRGLRVAVEWANAPKSDTADEVLRRQGIDISAVDDGLRQAYAALARRSEESVRFGPLISVDRSGTIDFLPGYGHEVLRGGPSADSLYSEFQLFQERDSFSILIEMKTPTSKPVDPTKIGIVWNAVRQGLAGTLRALYKGTRDITFENVGVYSEADGDWSYRLPYRVVAKP